MILLGSKVDKTSKTLMKISNGVEIIEFNLQHEEVSRRDDYVILYRLKPCL